MLSVGGSNPLLNSTLGSGPSGAPGVSEETSTTDPFVLGIKVFDLTALAWTNAFDPSDEPYESPQMIKDYYNGTLRYPSRWNGDGLRDIFVSQAVNGTSGHGNSTSTSGNTTSTGGNTASTTKSSSHGNKNTGAVAGGVVGGVVGLVAVGVGIWWLLVRKPQQRQSETEKDHATIEKPLYELDGSPERGQHELDGSPDRGKHELGHGYLSPEGRAELPMSTAPQK